MSRRYSEHLDKGFPQCSYCDNELGFNGDEFDEGQATRCFLCDPMGSLLYDEIVSN